MSIMENGPQIPVGPPNKPDVVSEMCKRNYEKEKSTICNATKKDLACLKGSLILQEEKSAQSKEILPVVQAEKEFMKKYEIIAQTLCATYNIPLNRFLSLIGRETDFIDHFQTKKFNRRSFGFCQLTKAVFDDMKANTKITPGGRGDKFVPFFNKILENKAVCETVSSGVSGKECAKTLDTLREVCVNGKITNKEKYNQAIESLYNLAQKDQHVNLFISTLFQNFHASNIARNNNDPVCEISPKNITQWRRTLGQCSTMQDSVLQKLVTHGDENLKISVQDIKIYREKLIQSFKSDQDNYQTFLTLSAYNGNNKSEKGGNIPHKVYYAMSIMISQIMRSS